MSKYRLYIERNLGYELEMFIYDNEQLLEVLDYYILDIKYPKKMIVIEYNKELNQDSVYFLYTGYYQEQLDDYMEFKNGSKSKTR